MTDTTALKKLRWVELEHQKNDLQIVFRDKEEHLKLLHEQELDEKINLINKLKQDL